MKVEPGLEWEDISEGEGPGIEPGQTAIVHYEGRFPDGRVFDSSRRRGRPFRFVLGAGQVIKGWDLGIAGMKAGGSRRLTLSPEFAYGAHGAGGVIPPNATLIFDVDLQEIGG
ncbi:MAG: FKBP-type peptidyl-prolyl cis-trans isomerase [Chthonomonadales bacterium]